MFNGMKQKLTALAAGAVAAVGLSSCGPTNFGGYSNASMPGHDVPPREVLAVRQAELNKAMRRAQASGDYESAEQIAYQQAALREQKTQAGYAQSYGTSAARRAAGTQYQILGLPGNAANQATRTLSNQLSREINSAIYKGINN